MYFLNESASSDRHASAVQTPMNDKKLQFIERMGLVADADGLPRIAGRIFAYLLLTPGESSLEDLADELGVSRASVSTDARRLAQLGILERRSKLGDRRDYYSVSPDAFRSVIRRRMETMLHFQQVMDVSHELAETEEVAARLAAWDAINRAMVRALEQVLADLEAGRPIDVE